nr:MAG TPA: hypothetical protein [Caudoviricetes sp.]
MLGFRGKVQTNLRKTGKIMLVRDSLLLFKGCKMLDKMRILC